MVVIVIAAEVKMHILYAKFLADVCFLAYTVF